MRFDSMNYNKTIIVGLLALAFAVIASAGVSAYDPYDGVNRIGTYYQHTNTYTVPAYGRGDLTNFYTPYPQYNYVAPPRMGGWFGSGSEWLVGLRQGVYQPVPPVRYTSYYSPVVPSSAYYGGHYGYVQPTYSQVYGSNYGMSGYRGRVGGSFSY
jgi:hypothetical protein